jgi:hypothetical protein
MLACGRRGGGHRVTSPTRRRSGRRPCVYEHQTGTHPATLRQRTSPSRRRRSGPALASASARFQLARRALTLATGLAAAAPVIVATVKAVRAHWTPGADQAIIATRAYDVFTSHPPRVGQYTLAGDVTGQVTHSLGPMLFWLLSIPAHFGTIAEMTWTMGIFNSLCIVGAVALARRRGGLVLMFAAAVAIALMCQSLSAETFHDVWNPSAGLFPFTLLIFLCWSLACGEYRLLALIALVASFVVQAHLTYLLPTVGMLLVGLGWLALSLRGSRISRRSLLVWSTVALVVLAFCWSAPVVDELKESPGNITLVVRSATRQKTTLGASAGWHAIVRAVGVRPWWLYVPTEKWSRKVDVRGKPAAHYVYSCIVLLAALLAMLAAGFWRRRSDIASGALIGFMLCAALAAVAASTPTPRVLSATLGYTMWWGSQVGMWIYLMLAWAAWLVARHLLAATSSRRRTSPRRPVAPARGALAPAAGALACIAALAATAAVGAKVASDGKPDEHAYLYRAAQELGRRAQQAAPAGSTVELLGLGDVATLPLKPAVRYYLVRHGVRPLAPGSYLRLGDWYELRGRPYSEVLWVQDGHHPPVRGARLLDRVHFGSGWGPQTVSLWLYPHGRGSARGA